MAFVTADRVLDSSTSTGTGAFVVSGTPAAGYRTFSAVMSVGDTCYYSIQGQTTSEWEVGLGTYSSANTLTRTTVYSSSNSNAAVTFSAGTKNIFITMAASKSVQLDSSGSATPAINSTANGTSGVAIASSNGAVVATTNGSTALTIDTSQNATLVGNMAMGSSFLRNRLINGNMYVAQRATSATVTAGTTVPTATTGYPCVDRWFVYSTGANVTAAQVAGSGANKNLLQITGAASVTAVGIGQRIEQINSYDLAGQTCTLSVNIANSVLTTVTWTASYATTANTFGTIGTATKTQIATGTFTVTSTLTQYTANISVPAAATTGIEILFTVGAQTRGTWQIGNVQFEPGSIATPFERKLYQQQLQDCQRHYFKFQASTIGDVFGTGSNATTTAGREFVQFPIVMRSIPTTIETSGTATDYSILFQGTTTACSVVPTFSSASTLGSTVSFGVASGLTAGNGNVARAATTAAYLAWPIEIP